MTKTTKILSLVLCYGVFFALVGYFSNSPAYQRYDGEQAMIKLSFQHAGKIIGECRERNAEEVAQLPANMRIVKVCPRERSPLQLELLIDEEMIYSKKLAPRGLRNDGMSSVYVRIPVKAGQMRLRVQMKDHVEQVTYPYRLERHLTVKPAQVLVIDFDSQAGEFLVI